MTVKELIEALKKHPEDAQIQLALLTFDGLCIDDLAEVRTSGNAVVLKDDS